MEVSGNKQIGSGNVNATTFCDPCQSANEHETAVSYCTNCHEYLCDTCARVHRKTKATRNHQLLNQDEMPSTKLTTVEESFCSKHSTKDLEFFCSVHNEFCCSICAIAKHTRCGVKDIEGLAEGFNTSQEYQDLQKQLKDIEKQLTDNTLKYQQNLEAVERNYHQLLADIKLFRTEINSALDQLEQKATEEALKIKTEDLTSLDDTSDICKQIETDLNRIISNFENLEKYKQNQQLVISTKKTKSQINDYSVKLADISRQNRARKYSFRRESEILKVLKSRSELGSLDIDKNEEKDTRQNKEEGTKVIKTKLLQPSFVKKIDINHARDRIYCCITGSVLINDNTVGLVDNKNSSVKVLDLQTDIFTSHIRLDDVPWDLTCIDPNTLVVTSDSKLTYLRYDGDLTVIKHVQMEAGCRGITYNNSKLFVTFRGWNSAVRILDKDGNAYKTLQTDKQGQAMFRDPQYIAVSTDGQSVYVSDYNNNTVTCLNMQGGIVGVYSHENLECPTGLTVDTNNTIYIASNKNIHRMTSRCEHIQVMVENIDSPYSPRTLLYNNRTGMMYISYNLLFELFSGPAGYLHVYKLKYINRTIVLHKGLTSPKERNF